MAWLNSSNGSVDLNNITQHENVTFTGDGSAVKSSKILSNDLVVPFGIPICLENLLTIIVLLRSHRLIYQVRILSINLAITDFLAGLVLSIPDTVFGDCNLKKYFTAPFINVSLFTVTMFNIDRCFAMKFALNYYNIMTKRVLVISCVIFWVLGTLVAYLMLYDPSHPWGIYCGIMYLAPRTAVSEPAKYFQLLTILSNFYMYIYMASALRKRLTRMNPTQPSDGNKQKDGAIKEQINVVNKLAVITGFFLFCCTPYFFIKILHDLDYENKIVRIAVQVSAGIMFLNSAINPVLYVWRFTEARYQFKRLLFFWSSNRLRVLKIARDNYFATYSISSNSA